MTKIRWTSMSLLLLPFGSAYLTATHYACAQTSIEVHTKSLPAIDLIEKKKAARTPEQKKVDSLILDTIEAVRSGQAAATASTFRAAGLTPTAEGIEVDITAKVTDQLIAKIKSAGGVVEQEYPEFDSIRASVPLDSTVEELATQTEVRKIRPAAKGRTNGISVAHEGDIAHAADLARSMFKVRGAGVKIGILSDSIDDADGSLQSAYDSETLDSTLLTILPGQQGNGGGEGLAMAEIVHTIAPEAHIYFATAGGGPAAMATNIRALRQQYQCDIIVDDYTYYIESPFQSKKTSLAGVIGQTVNDVSASGVLYFSSARNSGNLKEGTSGTWEGDFRDGGPVDPKFHVSDQGARVHMFADRVTLDTARIAGSGDRVDLFWADPLDGSTNDYDLFVVNKNGDVVRSATTSHDDGRDDPYESLPSLHAGESIIIVKSGKSDVRFLHLDTGRAVLAHGTDGSVRGHNASSAENAFTVAAVAVPKPAALFKLNAGSAVEKFSSDGPRRIFFKEDGSPITPGNFSSSGGKLINKPDIAAADGVSTSLPNSDLNPFFGTSAAAPHAAAIAALLLSCNPNAKPEEIRAVLQATAQPVEGPTQNQTAGFGVVMAEAAAEKICKNPTVSNSGPN